MCQPPLHVQKRLPAQDNLRAPVAMLCYRMAASLLGSSTAIASTNPKKVLHACHGLSRACHGLLLACSACGMLCLRRSTFSIKGEYHQVYTHHTCAQANHNLKRAYSLFKVSIHDTKIMPNPQGWCIMLLYLGILWSGTVSVLGVCQAAWDALGAWDAWDAPYAWDALDA